MASNWMRPKLDKMRKQGKLDRANLQQNDLFNLITFTPSHHDTDAMVAEFMAKGGKVHREACTGKQPYLSYGVMGKGKRTRDRRTYGNGTRKGLCARGILNSR